MNLRVPSSMLAGVASSFLVLFASTSLVSVGPVAAAQPPIETFFVAPTPVGSDFNLSSRVANDCTSKSRPCATIAQAISEEGAIVGGASHASISLAQGLYADPADTMFRALRSVNDDLTITGSGKNTVIEPVVCSALSSESTGPGASVTKPSGGSAIVDLSGLHGVTLENMTLNGGGLVRSGCSGYQAAVLSTGAGTRNTIDNVSISSGAKYAVQMGGGSQTSLSGDVVQPALCSATIKGPRAGLKAGWKYNQNLTLAKVPSCANGFTSVEIDGVAYSAGAAGAKKVVLTGGPKPPATPSIPRGSQLIFNTSVAAYTSVGIACNTLTEPLPAPTSCSVSSTTLSGGGTVYTSPGSPVGILVTDGATANLDGNKVAGNTDSTQNGIGIGLLPDTVNGQTAGPTVVGHDETNNSGSGCSSVGNDISILATAFPSVANSSEWQINQNTVSGDSVGVLLAGLDSGSNVGGVSFSSNTVTNTMLGPGVELADDNGAGGQHVTIGGGSTTLGNSISDNGIGIAVTEGTSSVTFDDNSITSNLSFGVAVDGPDAMAEFLPGTSTSGNTFTGNVWTGNGTPVPGTINGGANVIDFGGFSFPSPSQSIGGSASAQSTNVRLVTAIPAGTVPTSVTLETTSGTVNLGPGTLLTISGYCATSTFTCIGSNVSLFVTGVGSSVTGPIGNIAVVVQVAPIAPAVAVPLGAIAPGATVTSNGQVPLVSSNNYGAGNSCTPAAPNSSTTLKEGTGGGPSGPDGSVTGYLAC